LDVNGKILKEAPVSTKNLVPLNVSVKNMRPQSVGKNDMAVAVAAAAGCLRDGWLLGGLNLGLTGWGGLLLSLAAVDGGHPPRRRPSFPASCRAVCSCGQASRRCGGRSRCRCPPRTAGCSCRPAYQGYCRGHRGGCCAVRGPCTEILLGSATAAWGLLGQPRLPLACCRHPI